MSKQEQRETKAQPENNSLDPNQTGSVSESLSPGQQLVAGRNALGLTQQQIADRLHLRLSSVQAVEKDELEEGVSVTFNKGYVRLYAKLVQLDIQPLLDAYDKIHSQDNKPAKLQSFSRRVTREAHDHRWNMVTIVVVILVLGSVVGWWVQQSDSFKDSQAFVAETFENLFNSNEQVAETSIQNDNEKTETVNEQVIESEALDKNKEPDLQQPDLEVDESSETSNSPLTENEDDSSDLSQINTDEVEKLANDATQSAQETVEQTQQTAEEVVDTIDEQLAVDNEPPKRNSADIIEGVFTEDGYRVNNDGTVDLTFTFLDDCWVSIKDKDGEIIAYGVKKKGRIMDVAGIPPISVILGAPQNVEINFGGLEVDMSVYPGGSSAKFELPVGSE